MRRLVPMIVVLFVALFALATVVAAQDDETPSVTAEDQDVTGNTVMVASVVYTDVGWIVIHTDNNNAPGPVIGQTAIVAGENTDVAVELSEDVTGGQALWAMLHVDAGEEGTYEFPGADVPVFLEGEIVMQQFTVSTGEGGDAGTAETAAVTDTGTMTDTGGTAGTEAQTTPEAGGTMTDTAGTAGTGATAQATPSTLPTTGGEAGSSLPLGLTLLGVGLLFVVGAMLLRPRLR